MVTLCNLAKNGSPIAVFETDEDRTTFTVTIPIQPDYYNYKYKEKIDNETTPNPLKKLVISFFVLLERTQEFRKKKLPDKLGLV